MYLSGGSDNRFDLFWKLGTYISSTLITNQTFRMIIFRLKFFRNVSCYLWSRCCLFNNNNNSIFVTQQHQSRTVDNNFTNNTFNSFDSCIEIIFVVCSMSFFYFQENSFGSLYNLENNSFYNKQCCQFSSVLCRPINCE